MLQASVDWDNAEESHFRFLVDAKHIKYITIDAGVYTVDDMCFGLALVPKLPPLPPGDWNQARIAINPHDSRPRFVWAVRKDLPSVASTWHHTRIDHLELTMGKKLRSGVYEATSSRFQVSVVVKCAIFDWEIEAMDRETEAYHWIQGHNIAPRFLGHLTEEGRAIGFVMENMAGARHATVDDLESCREVLNYIHALGILHGDINKHNFLVAETRTVMIDFETATRTDDLPRLQTEMLALPEALEDVSGKGESIRTIGD